MRVSTAFVHFLHRFRLLKYFQIGTDLHYPKRTFFIPIIKGIGYAHCVGHEVWLLKLIIALESYFLPDKSFVDVGVNVGQTLLLLKSLYPHTRYTGFEPNPVCVEYTRELIRVNNIHHAAIHPVGLSNGNTEAQLNFYHRNPDDSSASVIPEFRAEQVTRRTKISLVRGDELKDWDAIKPGIIKIDVEGSELEVLTGITNVIAVYRPCIICEVLPVYSTDNEFRVQRQESLKNILVKNGYTLYHIDEAGSLQRIDAFSIHATINACNYVFMPEENDVFS
jgi:FkbM family methyltransferase